MKKLRLRLGAVGLGAALAAFSLVGAFALQEDAAPDGRQESAAIQGEPILYPGGYGLFPVSN